MKIAVMMRPETGAVLNYRDSILRELKACGVDILSLNQPDRIPADCDAVWEPGLYGLRRIPAVLAGSEPPVVGTSHGHGMDAVTRFGSKVQAGGNTGAHWAAVKEMILHDWIWYKKKAAFTTALSCQVASELRNDFSLPARSVKVVPHGIDPNIFGMRTGWQRHPRPYFFHISRMDRSKNMGRVFAAYARLARRDRPDLVALVPDYQERIDIPGVVLIRRTLSREETARWYRGAVCAVIPPLHESSGRQITEAMACGSPVITSAEPACAEAAGGAALLVNPRSVPEISRAMRSIAAEAQLWTDLRQKGLLRAKAFTWRKSAEKLLSVFEKAVSGDPGENN